MKFKNKVVLVTGGSSGIGEAIAKRFAEEGASVAISYNQNQKGAETVAGELEKLGGEVLIQQADLTKDDDAKKLVEAVVEKFGKIDILINNAGGSCDDGWDMPVDIWIQNLKQNLVSVMSVSKYMIEIFQKQQSGVIINIASRYATSGQFDSLSYSAAKAGVVNITQAYAKLLAPYGRANSVSHGPVNCGYWKVCPKEELTELVAGLPNGKLLEPGEVASVVIDLASSDETGKNVAVGWQEVTY